QFVRLQRPSADGTWETVDEVAFRRGAPWPANANGRGASLQLVDPNQDNRRPANWAAVLGTSTNAPVSVLGFAQPWRYLQDGPAPATWTRRDFSDASWPEGRGLLYVEDATLPAAKNTALTRTEGRMTYYFRTRFAFAGNPEGASLVLNTILDDGGIVHLNGTEIFRLGMDNAPATDATAANRTVADAVLEGPFTLPVTNLVVGDNVLAVEVHQVNATSSDIVWGASVDILEVRRESVTPGRPNSIRSTLPPFPDVWLNEVLPRNTGGILDNAGDRDPWIEIVHRGSDPVDLAGWWLTDDLANLTRSPFPSPAVLPASSIRLVWGDGEPAEQTPDAWHTTFRLAPTNGLVALVRPQDGRPAIVDFLEYRNVAADASFGIPTAAHPLQHGPLRTPSPGTENTDGVEAPLRITEISILSPTRLRLAWTSRPGLRYRVESRPSFDRPWAAVESTGEVTAVAAESVAEVPLDAAGPAFFRIVRTGAP
ncbi:MAG: lamin tail domain-containing protein, partial [Verrucomicrobiales bacterium]|nr:lamin tail domain-containing protein [Verrucomicrobiales bacterium]